MLDGIAEDFDGLCWMELGILEGVLDAQDDTNFDDENAGQSPFDED